MFRLRSFVSAFSFLLLLFTLPALAGDAPNPAAEPARVSIKGFKFIPDTITVKAGTTVEWLNEEKRQFHNVWFQAEGIPEPEYLFPGDKFTRTFDKAGTFPYRCGPHPEMTGKVVVE